DVEAISLSKSTQLFVNDIKTLILISESTYLHSYTKCALSLFDLAIT
ncbi:381_t:CDS:1, partial [Dentiscutata heterogama]